MTRRVWQFSLRRLMMIVVIISFGLFLIRTIQMERADRMAASLAILETGGSVLFASDLGRTPQSFRGRVRQFCGMQEDEALEVFLGPCQLHEFVLEYRDARKVTPLSNLRWDRSKILNAIGTFPETTRIGASDGDLFRMIVPCLPSFRKCERLNIRVDSVSKKDGFALAEMCALTELVIVETELREGFISELSRSRTLVTLSIGEVSGVFFKGGACYVKSDNLIGLENLVTLESIEIAGMDVDRTFMRIISRIRNLRSLDLSRCTFAVEDLRELQSSSSLELLNLGMSVEAQPSSAGVISDLRKRNESLQIDFLWD